jgi:type IV pilus biogenesis protein CpaD/CtpE
MRTYNLLAGLAMAALVMACASKPTETERNFGASVRNMIEAQTADPSTLSAPSTETIEDSDGRRLEAVLDVYRTDVAKPAAVSPAINADGQ